MKMECFAYVGTYTGPQSKGLYVCRFDGMTGRLSPSVLAAEVANPSFLAIHPSRRFLYAVSEIQSADGRAGGAVSAFSVGQDSGQLTLLNQVPSCGESPCHVAVDKSGSCLLAANYGSGSVALMGIGEAGQLDAASVVVKHAGVGVHPIRQQGPHAHSANPDQAGRFVLVADLGIDRIMVYRLDPCARTLMPASTPCITLPPGHGPRHMAFHPSGRFAYVINELANTVTVMGYDPENGALEIRQDLSTLPAGFTGASFGSEIRISPSGRHVYAGNRGHDSIAGYAVDPATGLLSLLAIQ